MAKRKKGRHRGASGKANTDLTAHIQSLGLKLEWTQTNKDGHALAMWSITEILNTRELQAEGWYMHHCVSMGPNV